MKRRLAVVLMLLVVLPVIALGALGARLIVTERQQAESRTRSLLLGQLAQHDTRMQEVLVSRTTGLMRTVPKSDEVDEIFKVLEATGAVVNAFLLVRSAQLVFPTAMVGDDREAAAFNRHVTALWRNRDPGFMPLAEQAPATKGGGGQVASQGWYTWYDESGLRFLFWWREPGGMVVGVELDRVRLMADLIAALPATGGESETESPARVVLVDARGNDVYQWGAYVPGPGIRPSAVMNLSAPFRSWRLDAYIAPGPSSGGVALAFIVGLGALLLALGGLGIYFYRESTRALRDAAQRVTFANQVSHELKTPLTNIRLYAELLEEDLEPDGRGHERLRVIVSESQRLSRLIGNILTFSRKQRHKLQLRPDVGVVGETVQHVIDHARPALRRRGIETQVTPPQEEGQVAFDCDVVEQVLNNLISNVEKYAAEGGYLGVSWEQRNGMTHIRVADRGPGVPEGEEERIFLPFYRVSNRLTDGVAGTGIGLAIARDLCRLHGGDLDVRRCVEGGLCFAASFETPVVDNSA